MLERIRKSKPAASAWSQIMQWEYKTIMISAMNVSAFNETVNRLGRERWEMVSCFGFALEAMLVIFKRPLAIDDYDQIEGSKMR